LADSTSNLPTISSSTSQPQVVANALFDDASSAMVYGRNFQTTSALTWGYLGGKVNIGGTITTIANGTLSLTASTTCYVEADASTGAVSVNTSAFTAGRVNLYTVVTGTATVTSYTDYRTSAVGFLNSAPASVTTIIVNAQTGTTYTVVTTDRSKLVTHSNASAIAVTLPQAGTSFPSGWFCFVENRGAGLSTITPTTSTIDGAASLTIGTDQGVLIASDGTNYYTMRGRGRTPSIVAVTYAATTTVDLSPYANSAVVILDLTLTGNVTFNLTNGTDGQVVKLRCRQDGTGSRIWTSGANIRLSADITSIVLSTGASKLDYLGFEWNGTNGKADVLAINKGF
jgi:hypothetical protein